MIYKSREAQGDNINVKWGGYMIAYLGERTKLKPPDQDSGTQDQEI